MDLQYIKEEQDIDEEFQAILNNATKESKLGEMELFGTTISTFKVLIWVPQSCRSHMVTWYHDMLTHTGATRTMNTIGPYID